MSSIIDRETARAMGRRTFFTGEPCGYGHVSERYVCNGRCLACCRTDTYRQQARHRSRRWVRHHPDLNAAREAFRRAREYHAVPSWLTDEQRREIEAFYTAAKATGIDRMAVDHIVALDGITDEGDPVCGLHVPWNLQLLPIGENTRKWKWVRQADALAPHPDTHP